jgi:hypothetical protein
MPSWLRWYHVVGTVAYMLVVLAIFRLVPNSIDLSDGVRAYLVSILSIFLRGTVLLLPVIVITVIAFLRDD